MVFTIEYRPETVKQGGPYEVKRGDGHAGLYQTAVDAYAAVESQSDASTPHVDCINVPDHIRRAAVKATPHR